MSLFRLFGYSLEEAVIALWQNRLINLIAITTVAISLFILGVFLTISINLNQLVTSWTNQIQLTLYLTNDLSSKEREELQATLLNSEQIESFNYVSKEDAATRFQNFFPEFEALSQLLESNPLPASLEVLVSENYRTPHHINALAVQLKTLNGITDVDYDSLWIERLSNIVGTLRFLGLTIGSALTLACVFIIFNVIKLTVYGRQEEIGIMRLVGATNGYIRGPFLVEGILQGGVGGVLGLALLYFAHHYVQTQALEAFNLFPNTDWLRFIPFTASVLIVSGGMVLGLVGSIFSVRRFLRNVV